MVKLTVHQSPTEEQKAIPRAHFNVPDALHLHAGPHRQRQRERALVTPIDRDKPSVSLRHRPELPRHVHLKSPYSLCELFSNFRCRILQRRRQNDCSRSTLVRGSHLLANGRPVTADRVAPRIWPTVQRDASRAWLPEAGLGRDGLVKVGAEHPLEPADHLWMLRWVTVG